MEEEIKALQKHMGRLVKTIIDLKSKVDILEKRQEKNSDRDIYDIMEKKIVLDKVMAANNEAIKKIEKELVNSIKKENKILVHDAEKQQNEEMQEVMRSKKRRYRYHN